jgi:DNA-binding NtrC family response regulator
MNLSIPILIADEHDEIRNLQREMLTKHGFFHLVEAHSREEIDLLMEDNQFVIIHKNMLNEKLMKKIGQSKNFLVVCQPDDPKTLTLAAYFGVKHLISFPYSAKSLVDKINSLLNQ